LRETISMGGGRNRFLFGRGFRDRGLSQIQTIR